MNGCNDNPNAQQFEGAYRKLLVNNEIKSFVHSNCLNDVTQILEVSSRPKSKDVLQKRNEISKQLEALANHDFILRLDDWNDKENIPDNSTLATHSMAYLASKVEAQVISTINRRGKKTCARCINLFYENERINDNFINFKSKKVQIRQPCRGTMQIIRSVDDLMERNKSQEVSLEAMVTYIFQSMEIHNLYILSVDHGHKEDLIKLIIRSYLDIKSTHVAKIVTRTSQKELIRHMRLKEVHRDGQ